MAVSELTRNAKGYDASDGIKQIAVRMPRTIFDELRKRAVIENRSIQQKIMDYISVGLDVDREWDIDEPQRHDPQPTPGQDFWDQ